MSGTACTIIIIGNQLKGDIAGLYEVLAETDLAITEEEKQEVFSFLLDTKRATDEYLTRVRGASGTDVRIITTGIQLEGNLGAVCDSAVDGEISETAKDAFSEYLAGQKKIAEKMLEKFRKRAEQEEYK